jgi:oxygen-dependent protoporphyrinogen oxidase
MFTDFQTLVDALHKEIGDGNVKLATQVLSLACSCDGLSASNGWSIFVDSKDASNRELAKNQPFDAVIMTVRNTHLPSC